MICPVSPWVLPESEQFSRRPVGLRNRPANFDAQFDRLTVFYDCFRISDGRVMLLAPPLTSFPGIIGSLEIHSMPSNSLCSYQVHHRFTTRFGNRRIDNLSEVLVDVPPDDSSLHLRASAGQQVVEIQPGLRELFRGRKALFTLSKNNDLQWICDWMRFHRDHQGADAVLLYDNGSTEYSVAALHEQMLRVSGFQAVCVVAWPFPYGPRATGRQVWDFAYSQGGVMEDARWRFLAEAYGVLNCDIDELALSREGNLFDRAASAGGGCLRFSGRWVTQAASSGTIPRHKDSTEQLLPQWRWRSMRIKDANLCPPKWVVAPDRCPADAHWSVHEIVGMPGAMLKQEDTCYRHFTRIGTNWKNNRHLIEGDGSKPRKKDADLQQAFSRVQWDQ